MRPWIFKAALHIRVAGTNPAEQCCDDIANASRAAEAVAAAALRPELQFIFDGFVDIDRGYFCIPAWSIACITPAWWSGGAPLPRDAELAKFKVSPCGYL